MAGARNQSWHATAAKRATRQAMLEVQRRFQRFSIAEYEANRHATQMIQVLVEIAADPKIDPMVRRQCALDVIERSDGKIREKEPRTVAPLLEEDPGGITLDHEAQAATDEARLLGEAERWISSGQPPSAWPQAIRDRFGPEALLALGAPD